MKQTFLIVLVAVTLAGCSSENDARKALTGAGYSNIQTDGYSVFGCSEDDTFHTKFTAKGPSGQPVEGVVCSGWLKGGTIRTK
jgi:hypothetical protein